MNNSLKLFFLIFNLVPSLTSSVNNFSQPLPETELEIGKNVSQIVERDGAINLVGGTRVVGFSTWKGKPEQKECTLSFPLVRESDGKKGFLTLSSCGSNYFVDGTKINDHFGPGVGPSSKGIDYTFIGIYPEFWSNENSPNVLYNDCDKAGCKTVPIPLLPTPNQDQLPLKTTVCAYGGASGYVCGEIVDFEATITVDNKPFHHVVKVSMNKPCLEGDAGAPVYIPFNVPNSKQMVADAVGQVVKDQKDSEINMWYYVPLTRTFKNAKSVFFDGRLKLAVGEKKEPIILHGGTTVQGVWNRGIQDPQPRSCTLSFPVKYGASGRPGFLTAYTCSSDDFFVQGAYGDLIQVGFALPPHNFDPSNGLDYRFMLADENYWSETDSKSIMSTEYLHDNMIDLLLPMTIPTKPPFTGVDVCVFGGLSKKITCGKILEFDVTIQVPVPGTNGKESVDFAKVVKVKMNDDYDLGYMGAPVYIPGQIPFTSQFIAHPVGQVVETLDQYKQDPVQETTIWYYIPIDRILKDSGMELFLGDFSRIGNKQVAMGGNSSNSKLQKRQGPYLIAGTLINLRKQGEPRVRTCTLGFAVKRVTGAGGRFNHGYFTAGSCASTRVMTNIDTAFVVVNNADEVIVGTRSQARGTYDPANGFDYTIVKVRANYWDPGPKGSMNIYVDGTIVPVIVPAVPDVPHQVCFVGGYSGLVCGHIHDLDFSDPRNSPWGNRNQYGVDYFQHMVLVGLSSNTRAQIDDRKFEDLGAPVFVPVWSPIVHPTQPRHLIGARPVGIFNEYVTVMSWNHGVDTAYFAYTPIQRILERDGNLELIQTPY